VQTTSRRPAILRDKQHTFLYIQIVDRCGIVASRRLQQLFAGAWTRGDLVAFHTAHKLLLMAHAPGGGIRLGRLVANARALSRTALQASYSDGFGRALAAPATRGRHANVLQHMVGYFTRALDLDGRAALRDAIERFASGLVPLTVPLALFRHHVRRCDVRYLASQTYLHPCPDDLLPKTDVRGPDAP
jgi:uncharacterized protein YbgA (DUF1722 family)